MKEKYSFVFFTTCIGWAIMGLSLIDMIPDFYKGACCMLGMVIILAMLWGTAEADSKKNRKDKSK